MAKLKKCLFYLIPFAIGYCSVFFIVKYCLDTSGWNGLVVIIAQYLVPILFGALIVEATSNSRGVGNG